MADFTPVTFYQGAPIDVVQLNKLQQNITSAWTASNKLLNATTNAGNAVPTVVVVYTDIIDVKIDSKGLGDASINFSNKFRGVPVMTASLAQDPKGKSYTVSALATTATSGKVYVVSNTTTAATIKVNVIAIEERQVSA